MQLLYVYKHEWTIKVPPAVCKATEVSTYVQMIALPPAVQEDLQGVTLNRKENILNVLIQF